MLTRKLEPNAYITLNLDIIYSMDSVDSGRISQFDDIITSLSPLISDNRSQFWATLGFFTLGIAIIGGITILRAATNWTLFSNFFNCVLIFIILWTLKIMLWVLRRIRFENSSFDKFKNFLLNFRNLQNNNNCLIFVITKHKI